MGNDSVAEFNALQGTAWNEEREWLYKGGDPRKDKKGYLAQGVILSRSPLEGLMGSEKSIVLGDPLDSDYLRAGLASMIYFEPTENNIAARIMAEAGLDAQSLKYAVFFSDASCCPGANGYIRQLCAIPDKSLRSIIGAKTTFESIGARVDQEITIAECFKRFIGRENQRWDGTRSILQNMIIACDKGGCGGCDIGEKIVFGLMIADPENPRITMWSSLESTRKYFERFVALQH